MHPIIEKVIVKVEAELVDFNAFIDARRARDNKYGPEVKKEQKKVVARWKKKGYVEKVQCMSWWRAQVIVKERHNLDFKPVIFYKEDRSHMTDEKDVYFARAMNGLTKIGMSFDVDKRVKSLERLVHPFKLKLIHIIPGGGHRLEQALHHEFRHLRACGEWFFLDMDDTTVAEL